MSHFDVHFYFAENIKIQIEEEKEVIATLDSKVILKGLNLTIWCNYVNGE
mgnify:CR=1 FL=1